jgi:hypothetical protein
MIKYTNEESINDILHEAEEKLIEVIGRYEAQRFIALFADLDGKGFNVWQKVFDKGREAKT